MSQKTVAQLAAEIAAQLPTNGANLITAAMLRTVLGDMVDSSGNILDHTSEAGPTTSTDKAIARFNGTDGRTIQNSAATIADTTGNITAGTYNGNTIGAGSTSGTNTGDNTLGAGVATFLATPSSANLKSAVTDETGSGALVFADTPTLVTPLLGTPTSGNMANATGVARMPAPATLTDGATITWAMDPEQNEQTATVTLGGNRALAFSGNTSGMRGVLIVKQDGTPPRTMSLPSGSKVIGAGAGAITLSNAANAIDILSWFYDGTNIYWNYGRNFT